MPTKSYRADLLVKLQNIEEAAAYLTACYHDSEEVFLLGLRDVVEAHGGVGEISRETALNRESLYRVLSKNGNPTLATLAAILNSVGLQLEFSAKRSERRRA
jgi:probable addiction module antidote protein